MTRYWNNHHRISRNVHNKKNMEIQINQKTVEGSKQNIKNSQHLQRLSVS